MDYNCKFARRIQGIKTADISIGQDRCMVEEVLQTQDLIFDTASQAEKDAVQMNMEEQLVMML